MLKAKTPLLVGLLVLVAAGAFIFTFGTLDKGMSEEDMYVVYARFDDASGLAPDTRVSLAGIVVGRLGTPELDPDRPALARVPLHLAKTVVLRMGTQHPTKKDTWTNGAAALRRQSSLIGDYDVALSAGLEGPIIPPGGTIPNITGETGLPAIIKTLEDSSKIVFPALEKITADVEAITTSLRDTIGDEKGAATIEKIKSDVAKTTDNVQHLTSEMRSFLSQQIYPRGDNINRILVNLERTSAQLASTSTAGSERIERILERVERITNSVGRFVDDQTASPETAKDGTVGKTLAGLEKSMALIEGSLENIRSVTENLEQGRGTIGRLLTDDKLITDIERVIGDVEDFTSAFSRTQIKVQFRTDYYVGRGAYKTTIDFALQPGPDKYYLFQFIDDPIGKATRKLRVTTSNDPRVPPVLVEEITETSGDFKITAQFAKRFHFMTFRYGVMESTGGLGIDADLLEDALNFQLDIFEFGRDKLPHFRVMAQWEFLSHFFLSAGIDDMLNSASRDWFLGVGVRFVDEDIKSVLPLAPSP